MAAERRSVVTTEWTAGILVAVAAATVVYAVVADPSLAEGAVFVVVVFALGYAAASYLSAAHLR